MIGKRNRLVEFWKPTGAVDAANQPLPDAWQVHKSKWAEIKGETGIGTIRSAASAGNINTPLNRYSFRVNYDLSLEENMQVRYGGMIYAVVTIRHDHAQRRHTDVVAEIGGTTQ